MGAGLAFLKLEFIRLIYLVKKLFLAFCFVGLLGCGDKKAKLPAGLLPPDKITSILADIHIAESRVELMHVSPDTANVVFRRLELDIFKKHKVSEPEFTKTYNYYLEHIGALDKVYEGLVDTLTMREVRLTSEKKPSGKQSSDQVPALK